MTNKEIAERLRHIAEYNLDSSNLRALADELDSDEDYQERLDKFAKRLDQYNVAVDMAIDRQLESEEREQR